MTILPATLNPTATLTADRDEFGRDGHTERDEMVHGNDHDDKSKKNNNDIADDNDSHNNDDEDNDIDDTLVYCRCHTPQALVELLRSFGGNGASGSAWKTTNDSGGAINSNISSSNKSNTNKNKSSSNKSSTGGAATTVVTVFCTPRGLTVHSHHGSSTASSSSGSALQASLELPVALFQDFRLIGGTTSPNDDENRQQQQQEDEEASHEFTVHWKTLMECLTLLMVANNSHTHGPCPALALSYHTSTDLLQLELLLPTTNNNNIPNPDDDTMTLATCALPGLGMELDHNDHNTVDAATAYRQSPVAARCLTSSCHWTPHVWELDHVPGATTVRVTFVVETTGGSGGLGGPPPERYLKLSAKGHASKVVVQIPGPIELEEQREEEKDGMPLSGYRSTTHKSNGNHHHRQTVTHTYSLASWRQALQPLDLARETCISVNQHGILAVQHQLVLADIVMTKAPSSSYNKGEYGGGGGRGRGGQGRRGSYSRGQYSMSENGDHQDDDDDTAAFCDFLLLPLVNLDDDGDNVDSDSDKNGYGDDEEDDSEGESQSVATTQTRPAQESMRHDTTRNRGGGGGNRDRRSRRTSASASSTPKSPAPALARPTQYSTAANNRNAPGSQPSQTQDSAASKASSTTVLSRNLRTPPPSSGHHTAGSSVRTNREGNEETVERRGTHLPFGSADKSGEETDDDEDRPLPASHRRPLFFGRRQDYNNTGDGEQRGGMDSTLSASQMTEDTSSVLQQQQQQQRTAFSSSTLRDRRKRRRHQHHHSLDASSVGTGTASCRHDEDDDNDQGQQLPSPSPASPSDAAALSALRRGNGHRNGRGESNDDEWRRNRGFSDDDGDADQDEDRYCSSPELLYGDEE